MKASTKYIAIVILSLLTYTQLYGQITGGIEGEITTSSVKITDIPNSFVKVVNGNDITGYEAGLFLKVGLGPVYAKPKFLISHQSGMVEAVYADQNSSTLTMNVTKLDIPVLIGLNIFGPISLEAGPVYNRILFVTEDFNGHSVDIRPGGLGYRIGANAQVGVLGFNVAYQGTKNNSSDSMSSFENRNQVIFGASFSFGK